MTWYWVNTTYACGGVAVDESGKIVMCAPIWKREFLGKPAKTMGFLLRVRRQWLGAEKI